ncbi:MAG: 8-amino-7-oxononanoate synthase [Candidatus Taylorbacteria bacterium]|nr:8-amino-7-oxononanoate synthase [Candidatus Taylorbacteria bacterium]
MKYVKRILDYADKNDLYPDMKIIDGPAEPEVFIDGRKVLMFSSNNYLGLSNHPKVIESAIAGIKEYGVGSDGSRLLSGNIKIHREFEKAIAKFKGGEDAIVWPTGYAANLGTISALMNPFKVGPQDFLRFKGVIISDELNHASIIDGAKLSKQIKAKYKHRDMTDLESQLKRYKWRRKLIVTDSVFSMDGDIAPLDKIAELKKKYNAMLMIDEAHATGILGKTGHGSLEHFGLRTGKDVDIVLGTCSKALAATGGFVVGDRDLVRFLRVASRSYMFSTAMMPAASAALIKALEIIETEPQHRIRLLENSDYLRNSFHELGFDTLTSQTQIIPILIGDDRKAIAFSRRLLEEGIFGPNVRWPAVEKNKARIRFTVMATHTKEQMNKLLNACKTIKKELNLT